MIESYIKEENLLTIKYKYNRKHILQQEVVTVLRMWNTISTKVPRYIWESFDMWSFKAKDYQ